MLKSGGAAGGGADASPEPPRQLKLKTVYRRAVAAVTPSAATITIRLCRFALNHGFLASSRFGQRGCVYWGPDPGVKIVYQFALGSPQCDCLQP